MHISVLTDLYVKTEPTGLGGTEWESRGGKTSREEAADRSWLSTEIALFVHIKSFLNMDSREQSASLSARLLWTTLPPTCTCPSPRIFRLHSSQHCCSLGTCMWRGALNGISKSKNTKQKRLWRKCVMFKHNLIWVPLQTLNQVTAVKRPFSWDAISATGKKITGLTNN